MKKSLSRFLFLTATLVIVCAPLVGQAISVNPNLPPSTSSNPPSTSNSNPPSTPKTTITYTPLEPLTTGLAGFETGNPQDFSNLVNGIYKLFIGLGAILAVAMLVLYGITYMTSEVAGTKATAKRRLLGVMYGMIILLGAWIILNTINPQLLSVGLSTLTPLPTTGSNPSASGCVGSGCLTTGQNQAATNVLNNGNLGSSQGDQTTSGQVTAEQNQSCLNGGGHIIANCGTIGSAPSNTALVPGSTLTQCQQFANEENLSGESTCTALVGGTGRSCCVQP